jgi:multidrug efflux pump subunit AcrB
LAALWAVEALGQFLVVTLLVCYANVIYWAVDRFFLEPVLLRPTEWVLNALTGAYALLLRWSLRFWYAVLVFGLALILVTVGFLYFDLLGRELVPSEDQSRFVVHVICPVGSSIDYVDEMLALVGQDRVDRVGRWRPQRCPALSDLCG